jgi:ParB family chromosome partitioning protein
LIQVNNSFRALIPPLSAEERAQLEANLLADGCREPLALWGEVLLDGHNRYEICTRLGIDYRVVQVDGIQTESDATLWIVRNQLGRRNISDYVRAELALVAKPLIEAKARANLVESGERFGKGSENSHEPIERIRTDETLADMAGVSSNTIRKVERIAQQGDDKLKELARSDDVSIHLASQVLALPEEEQQQAVNEAAAHPKNASAILREAVKAHVSNNSGNNEWYTPPMYVQAAKDVMGSIDVDPASCELANATVQAATFYDERANGLTKTWSGNVWMNPPYAQPLITQFCSALVEKFQAGEVKQACVLVNNGTETGWFQSLLEHASAACLVKTRIKFIDKDGNPSGAPLQGQAILYLGKNTGEFSDVFSSFGKVLYA